MVGRWVERGRVGGACLWPGGPIPLGDDGAYGGRCDSWDSFSPFLELGRRGVSGLRGQYSTGVHIGSRGVGVHPASP